MFRVTVEQKETKKADELAPKGSERSEEKTIEGIYALLQEHFSKLEKASWNSANKQIHVALMYSKQNRYNTFCVNALHFRTNVVGFSVTERLKI